MSRRFIVFDTECTGLKRGSVDPTLPATVSQRGDEVCQIGGMILDERMTPQKLFCHYCDTVAAECSPGAFAVNQISMREVRKYVQGQFLSTVLHDRVPEFYWDNSVFVGYNIEFDMDMVKQTVANTNIPFEWKPLRGSIIPKEGRWSVDVSEFFKYIGNVSAGKQGHYRKLSTFEKELEADREKFFQQYGSMEVETNCIDLLAPSWERSHNAFFDALNTYLLWRDRVWRKKLL